MRFPHPFRFNYFIMSQLTHRYITVAYKLYADNANGVHEIIEEAPAEYPFQFITNLGMALESFEARVCNLNEGDTFDFTLGVDEAYGPYEQERVVEVPKENFFVDGRFASDDIYPGNMIPLVNEDGNHFYGLVSDVKENTVIIDVNHMLAGKELHYVGTVVTAREATEQEIQGVLNMHTSEGCGCGCGDGEGGGCGCGEGDGGCGCGGHDHDHDHKEGGCCCGGCGCH